MGKTAAIIVLATLGSTARGQEDYSTRISFFVRPYGSTGSGTQHLTVVHPDFSPVDVEVLVYYTRGYANSLASVTHNIVGSPFAPALGDAVEIIDNPENALHPDGRKYPFNYGAQRQQVFFSGTAGVDADRFRIAAAGNLGDNSANGISIKAAGPLHTGEFHFPELAYSFRMTVGCAPDGLLRTVTINAPRDRITKYSVYTTSTSTNTTDVLATIQDSVPAFITISAPAPAPAALFIVSALAFHRRRRSSCSRVGPTRGSSGSSS